MLLEPLPKLVFRRAGRARIEDGSVHTKHRSTQKLLNRCIRYAASRYEFGYYTLYQHDFAQPVSVDNVGYGVIGCSLPNVAEQVESGSAHSDASCAVVIDHFLISILPICSALQRQQLG